MHLHYKRMLSILFIFLLLFLMMLPIAQASDGAAFGTAFSSVELDNPLRSWTDISAPSNQMRQLLNSQPLHPQRTGWLELDRLIESILASTGEDADTYDKLRYAYDWMVENVTYSWDGYSYRNASVRSYNSFTDLNYLSNLTYEVGLDKSIPDDMANRTYHLLYAKKGVCYDYAIAFSVIARYVGIEAYPQTGPFVFEDAHNGTGHHGWAILLLDGTRYIFDPQRDARNLQYNNQNGFYFGILEKTALNTAQRPSYQHEQADITAFNQRLQQILPVSADRYATVTVPNYVTGGGRYALGSTAVLTVSPLHEHLSFDAWYTGTGTQIGNNNPYSFTVTAPVTLTVKLTIDQECTSAAMRDLDLTAWYHEYTDYVLERGMMQGYTGSDANLFKPTNTLTRAQACQILYNMEGRPNTVTISPFLDVAPGQWCDAAVSWAAENGIVNGIGQGLFKPDSPVTRQQLAAILYRYADYKGANTNITADLSGYPDASQISSYAQPAMQWANASGMITGTISGDLNPTGNATRAAVAKIFTQFCKNVLLF